ncbi:murein biosynthesis integral membrane protein MurJ [Agromyces sp. ZXT2-6]|uniref:murein biosynthesis integral membrane protein MurJ n=1 Tax=Agromyces sp. ZXT2-6 TaxID=3461153 RepID=UPI0040552730
MAEDRIARASLFLASGTIVSRLLGFLKAIVLAGVIGVAYSQSADAFAIANGLPSILFAIVAGGVLSAVLVPQIVRASVHEDGGAAYVNKLLTLALVLIGAATIIATAAAPLLVLLWGGSNPDIVPLATAFAFFSLPQIFFYGLYALLGEVLNARRNFGPYTWVPALNNIVAIAGFLLFGFLFGFDPTGERTPDDWTGAMVATLAGAATLGIITQAVSLFWFWRRVGLRYRPDFHWRGVGLRSAGRMAGWTFGMLLLTTAAGIVQTQVVASASGQGAANAAMDTAWLIFMLPHSVITVSIATAYFTRMSEHGRDGRLELLRADLSSATRTVVTLLAFASTALVVVAYPFARVFQSGDFALVAAVANVIIAFAIGLVGFSVLFLVQRTFYALNDTRTPFLFTLFQVVTFTALALVALFTLPKDWLAVGVAFSTTVAGSLQLLAALLLLRRRLGSIGIRSTSVSFARAMAALILPSAAGIALVWWLGGFEEGGFAVSDRISALLSMALVGAVMAALYLGCLWLLRSPELRALAGPVLARLRRR